MEEVTYMVCMRVDELEEPVEGSTTTACVECGDDIWISAESRKELGRAGAMPLCSTCAVRVAQDSETLVRSEGITEGQLDEVLGALRKARPELMAVFDDDSADNFEIMKTTATMASEHMRHPNDDFGSMVVMEDYEGHLYPPLPLTEMMKAGVPKEVLAKKLLPACVQAAQAKRVLMGLSAWALTTDHEPETPISSHPDREEALVIIDITADGIQQMSTAAIIRDGVSPPRLGEWHDSEEPSEADGLFVDALVPTLQLVRTLRSS